MQKKGQKGQVVLLGDFNARLGKPLDDVMGMFGEGKCNVSGNRLISFLNEVELVIVASSLWNYSGLELLDLLRNRSLSLIIIYLLIPGIKRRLG